MYLYFVFHVAFFILGLIKKWSIIGSVLTTRLKRSRFLAFGLVVCLVCGFPLKLACTRSVLVDSWNAFLPLNLVLHVTLVVLSLIVELALVRSVAVLVLVLD